MPQKTATLPRIGYGVTLALLITRILGLVRDGAVATRFVTALLHPVLIGLDSDLAWPA
jgi:peptidoglycan biosynthesis protein MviN/MurJ (putative lipid II flippase)